MSKLALLLLLCTELAMAGDLKIVTRHSSDSPMDQPRTETIYLHGQRERREFHAGNFTGVTIYQGDLHRMISFNEESKSYRVWPLDEHGRMTMPAGLDLMPASRLTRSGNKVTFVETVKDTGERKDFFGFTAKRLVKTTTVEPRQTSCSNYGEGEQVDGWYIEAPGALGCTPQSKGLIRACL